MREEVRQTLWELIYDYGLHAQRLPIELSPLQELFVPVNADTADTGVLAFAVSPRGDALPTKRDPAHVVIDRNLPEPERRLCFAHEVGHVIGNHIGSLRSLQVNEWFHDKNEREAWEVAAELLVPLEVFMVEGRTTEEIAALCEVPLWLVELHKLGRG